MNPFNIGKFNKAYKHYKKGSKLLKKGIVSGGRKKNIIGIPPRNASQARKAQQSVASIVVKNPNKIEKQMTQKIKWGFPFKEFILDISLPLTGMGIGYIIGKKVNSTIDLVENATNYIEGVTQNMRVLENGGTLGVGYMTQDSATERARLSSALRNTSEGGRRNLGNEASIYAGSI